METVLESLKSTQHDEQIIVKKKKLQIQIEHKKWINEFVNFKRIRKPQETQYHHKEGFPPAYPAAHTAAHNPTPPPRN